MLRLPVLVPPMVLLADPAEIRMPVPLPATVAPSVPIPM